MDHTTFLVKGLEDLADAAKWLLNNLGKQRIIAFDGEMGAGKTTFIQSFCKELGVQQEVTSPTFALINEYHGKDNLLIYHFDFYRIEDPAEALDFGLEEYLYSGGYCLMEWPEKVDLFLPSDMARVEVVVQADQSRLLRLA